MTIKKTLLTTAYCLGLLLLLGLGSWQIARGLEKADILAQAESNKNENKPLTTLPSDPALLNYQTATLQGSWDKKRIILLANRIYQNQLGYEVIVPFHLRANNGDESLILINRGWIHEQQQLKLPPLTPTMPSGTLYLPKKGFTLGEAFQAGELTNNSWPKTSLYMDLDQFSLALGQTVSPLLLVLNAKDPNSLTRIWKPVVIQPERHYAYALQWYGLAIAFGVFGIIWFRRARQNQPHR